jgi:hypothetical protein
MAGRDLGFDLFIAAALAAIAGTAAGCGDDTGAARAPIVSGAALRSGDLDIAGLTTDDVAAVLDQQQGALAIDVATGDALTVDAAADLLSVDGPAIIAFHNDDLVTGIGDMVVWTRASGAVAMAHDATPLHVMSPALGRMLVTEASSSDGTTTRLVVKSLDGSSTLPVATISRVGACAARVGATPAAFVVSYCPPGSDTVALAAVDAMTGAMTSLSAEPVAVFRVIPGGGELVAVISTAGHGTLTTTAGGVVRDYGGNVAALAPAADGSAVFVRAQGALVRAPIDGAASTTLVTSGVASIRAVSASGAALLFNGALATRNGYGSLLLTSGETVGGVTTLVATTDGTTFGSAFTADESRALYISGAGDELVGTLRSQSVAGGPSTVHGERVWTVNAYAHSRVVFSADYAAVPKRPGHVTLAAADTSSGAAPTVIATDAGAYGFVTAARDRVVFSFHGAAGDGPGLYVASLP